MDIHGAIQPDTIFFGTGSGYGKVKESEEARHAPNCITVEATNQSGARTIYTVFSFSAWEAI